MPAAREDSHMVRAVLSMVIREGCAQEFERLWREHAEQASKFPGCLGQALTCNPLHPESYIITGDWESADALHAFEGSMERRSLSQSVEPLRESSGKTVLTIVSLM